MALKLCKNDFLVKTLRETYQATPLRIPQKRVQPLCALMRKGKKAKFQGDITKLLTEGSGKIPTVHTDPIPDIKGKRSKTVKIDLGMKILEGFMSGFGISSANIGVHLNKVKTVDFSFKDSKRYYFEPVDLGAFLGSRKLADNPAAREYLEKRKDLLIINSVFVSKDFSIKVDESSQNDFNNSVDNIKQAISDIQANVKVTTTNNLDITFTGEDYLTFAFAAIELEIDEHGNLSPENFTKPVRSMLEKMIIENDTEVPEEEDYMIEIGDDIS